MRKPNKKGCIPSEDVCIEHDQPLTCRHGCGEAIKHNCKYLEELETINRLAKLIKDEKEGSV